MLDSRFATTGFHRPLRIAQIAPLFESVPPKLYGGTERVIAWLSEALARRGHKVTLFASGDSTAQVPLEARFPRSLRLAGLDRVGLAYHLPMLSDVYDRADEFDVIHSHLEHLGFPFAHLATVPTISTMHGRIDLEDFRPIYDRYADLPLVSIVKHRMISSRHELGGHDLPRPSPYFVPPESEPWEISGFFGQAIARKASRGRDRSSSACRDSFEDCRQSDRSNEAYFNAVIKPLLSSSMIEYVGEISESQKQEFLGSALALLFPIDWPEPFGLVMIEALACGTPVVARPFGSVPEILRDGVSGLSNRTSMD